MSKAVPIGNSQFIGFQKGQGQGYQQFEQHQKQTNNEDPYAKPHEMNDELPKPELNQVFDQVKGSSDQGFPYSPSLGDNARSKFIAKVFILVSMQLLLTSIVGLITYNNNTFASLIINPAVYSLSTIGLITISIIASCCSETFRRYALPLFVLFTFFTSFIVSMSIIFYEPEIILAAFFATFAITFGLTIYAWKTKSDFTGYGPYLFVMLFSLCIFGILTIFIWQLYLFYSWLCVIVFGMYLVYDVQLVIGRGQYSFSLDDAYLAALNIYLDIINLFLHLLRILNQARRN